MSGLSRNMSPHPHLDDLLANLLGAIASDRTDATCHRLWSRFIRARDSNRCVICASEDGLAAHHVFRRSFMPIARFQTGNGATLCLDCHREAHAGFNGRADLQIPVDSQGGEKLEMVAELFNNLAHESGKRYEGRKEFYFLSDQVLTSFKIMQGFEPEARLAGSPIEQAWYIWDCSPVHLVRALVQANIPS
jgi:hypothetical protein